MKAFKAQLNNELPFAQALKFIPRLGLNYLFTVLNKKTIFGPTFLAWVITDQCQSHCQHCYRELSPITLSKDERLKIVKNIANSSVNWVSLVGGEPLILPEVLDIIKILKKAGKKVTVTTNGINLPQYVQAFIDIKLDAIHISVDSHIPEMHDSLRNTPGLLDKISKTIADIKAKRSSKIPLIKLRCTLSRINFKELNNYVKFWESKVDALHFQPIVDITMNRVRNKELLFKKEDEKDFRKTLNQLQKSKKSFANHYYNFMPDFIFDKYNLYKRLNYKCLLLSSSGLCVLPDGEITICVGLRKHTIGNAVNQNIEEIFKSRDAAKLRKKILDATPKKFCDECFCWESNTLFNLHLLKLHNFFAKK